MRATNARILLPAALAYLCRLSFISSMFNFKCEKNNSNESSTKKRFEHSLAL